MTLQFFVYIASWNIRFPPITRFLLHELRKISLGEFLDDFEIGKHVLEPIGIVSQSDSATDEKVGEERLGSGKGMSSSFGTTLILASIGFAVLIAVVLLTVYLCKRLTCSAKCKTGVRKLKQKVFWNPFIRYIFLNSLKLNMATFVVFKSMKADTKTPTTTEISIAISICVILHLVVIVFYCVLKRHHEQLKDEATVNSIGSLYSGKDVHSPKKRVHSYMVALFVRRGLFVATTVYLFD